MNDTVFGKAMENVIKPQISNLQQLKKEIIVKYQNQTFIHIFFSENLLAIQVRKMQILISKPV